MKNFHCVNPAQYGTQHVLVLADFPPSTKTIDLERLLGNFMNSGVVIRWVNDTVALAVFQTPSAGNSRKTRFSFLGNIVGQCLSLVRYWTYLIFSNLMLFEKFYSLSRFMFCH